MRNTCINHPTNEPLLLIRQWQVTACDGNHCAAALLNFFEYWHNIKLANRTQVEAEQATAQAHGEEGPPDQSLLQWHTEQQLIDGLLGLYKRDAIRKAIALLESKLFIRVQNNPNPHFTFDKTRHFGFNAALINEWLHSTYSTMSENQPSSSENRPSSSENQSSSSENRPTSPKTTPEITPEKKEREERAREDFSSGHGDEGEEERAAFAPCPVCGAHESCHHDFTEETTQPDYRRQREVPPLTDTDRDMQILDPLEQVPNHGDEQGPAFDGSSDYIPATTPSLANCSFSIEQEVPVRSALPDACQAYHPGFACPCMHTALVTAAGQLWPGVELDPVTALSEFVHTKPQLHTIAHTVTPEEIASAALWWRRNKPPREHSLPLFFSQFTSARCNAQAPDQEQLASAERLERYKQYVESRGEQWEDDQ